MSQSVGVREAEAYMGWSTHIFARICVNATIMIGNIPAPDGGKEIMIFGISRLLRHIHEHL